MRVLLDTRLLLWALSSPAKLSKRARQRINSSEVYASAASIWEISIKCALGKLKADPAFQRPNEFTEILVGNGDNLQRMQNDPNRHRGLTARRQRTGCCRGAVRGCDGRRTEPSKRRMIVYE